MIYNIYRNNGKGIGFSEGKPNETNLKACCECIKEGLKTFFVPEGAKFETVVQPEPEASSYKAKCWIFVCWLKFFLKQIFTSDMEHDVPTSRHGFCVFCTLPYFSHAFVYLRNPRLH